MNRIIGMLVTVAWVAAMAALIHRDVLPYWSAQEPPSGLIPSGKYQIAIHCPAGQRIGTTWIAAASPISGANVHSLTVLNVGGLVGSLPVPKQIGVETTLSYDNEANLDQFLFLVHGAGLPIQVGGTRYARDFACTATLGPIHRTVPLDARVSQCLGESLRPFTHLEDLHVGQTWRIRLLDPYSLIQSQALDFRTQLARVVAREPIGHNGRQVTCFRIETPGTIAWADDRGRILRQEVQVPLLGTWILTDEPYDAEARRVARAWTHLVRLSAEDAREP